MFRVENVLKKLKNSGLWDYGLVTGEPGQKPDWKKWPGLSDSDMVTGGLILTSSSHGIFSKIFASNPPDDTWSKKKGKGTLG